MITMPHTSCNFFDSITNENFLLQHTSMKMFIPNRFLSKCRSLVGNSVMRSSLQQRQHGAHWVPLPLVHKAMQPINQDTNYSNAYLLLSAPQPHNTPTQTILQKTGRKPCNLLYVIFLPMEQPDAHLAFLKRHACQINLRSPPSRKIVDYLLTGRSYGS